MEVTRRKNGTEGVYQCAVKHPRGVVLGYPQKWKFACEYQIFITLDLLATFLNYCLSPLGLNWFYRNDIHEHNLHDIQMPFTNY